MTIVLRARATRRTQLSDARRETPSGSKQEMARAAGGIEDIEIEQRIGLASGILGDRLLDYGFERGIK